MLICMCTAAQFAEIPSLGVHLPLCFIVRKETACIPRPNTPEFFFLPRYRAAHGCGQEPTPGSTALFGLKTLCKNLPLVTRQHICWFLGTGGGGVVVKGLVTFSLRVGPTKVGRGTI